MKPDALLFSIVRIVSGRSLGTGFLLDGGWVVTCAHNIPDTEHIELLICDPEGNFNTQLFATLEKCLPEAEGDLASFRITRDLPEHARPLVLTDSSVSEGKTCRAYGFPNNSKTNGLPFNSARIDSFDSRSTVGWRQMILADAAALGPGYSGSPLVEYKHRILVGMVLQRGNGGLGLARGIPSEFIAARLGLPCAELSPYPDLIERIDRRFLLEQAHQEGPRFTAEAFYTADPPSQWWGVMNGLVARKTIYENLLKQINVAFYGNAPVLALLDGAGGMGKTTTARLLLHDLHEQFDCWWIDDTVGEDLDEILPEFLESRKQYGRDTLLLLDDWGKFSEGSKGILLQFMRRQLKKGESSNIRFVITAKPDEHGNLTHELLDSHARFGFDAREYLKADNEQIVKTALAHLNTRFAGLYSTLFNPDDQLLGKPFHLLFILLRAADDETLRQELSSTLHNAEGKFRQVMQYDFNRLWNDFEKKGQAISILFVAYLQFKHKYHLPYEAFKSLVIRYSPHSAIAPGQWLDNNLPEHWGILSHYIQKYRKSSSYPADISEFVFFKKDEYSEHLLHLDIPFGGSVVEYLKAEKKPMIMHLLYNGGMTASSILSYFFSSRENLLSEEEKIATIVNLLKTGNTNPTYTNLFLGTNTLPNVSFDQKWSWVLQFNKLSPNQGSFHSKVMLFLKRERKNHVTEYITSLIDHGAISDKIFAPYFKGTINEIQAQKAKELLYKSNNTSLICICLDSLYGDPELINEAKRFLKSSDNPYIICKCLHILRNTKEAKEKAKILLSVTHDPMVLSTCFNVLRNNQYTHKVAKRLLIESHSTEIICKCLDVLRYDPDVKIIAKRLLKQKNKSQVISKCLDILRYDPDIKIAAKQLLKQSKSNHIISRCLDILRDDPDIKKEAVELLMESNSQEIIGRSLDILRDEPEIKGLAKKFIKNSKSAQVIWMSLNILRNDPTAKEIAKDLLKRSNDQNILCLCLEILREDPEVKQLAKQFLKESTNQDVICKSLDLLHGAQEVTDEVKKLLFKSKHPFIVSKCINILKVIDPNCFEVTQLCIRIISNWENENSNVVSVCLSYLPDHPKSILLMKSIINNKMENFRLYNDIMQRAYEQHNFWKNEVLRVVQNWSRESRIILGHCLTNLAQEPKIVQNCCRQILLNWEQECITNRKYQVKKSHQTNDNYLQIALAHPYLRSLSIRIAKEMYSKEQKTPGFLSTNLRYVVTRIIGHLVFPIWGQSEEV